MKAALSYARKKQSKASFILSALSLPYHTDDHDEAICCSRCSFGIGFGLCSQVCSGGVVFVS